MQETRVWSLVWEDPLEKEMATHSSILAWRTWTEEPSGLVHGVTKSQTWLSHEHLWDLWIYIHIGASLVAQMVKNLPAMRETWVWSLGWEDALVEGMATHSSILAWTIPWTEERGGLQSMVSQRVGHNWETKHSTGHIHIDTHVYY